MLFNSLPFLVFLPVVYLLYWATPRRHYQNAILLLGSYVFYGWWDWRFLSLILISSAVDFLAGPRIHSAATPARRKAWLGLSLAVNLGLLGFFKYAGWGIESLAALLESLGFTPHLPTLRLILPVGISFYTFQTLSYTIDIYRGRLEPTRDVLAFFAFVAFFPQLVAGPIERASSLLGQLEKTRTFDRASAADGCRQMLYGLFLKVVIADNLAPLVDAAYGDVSAASPAALLYATYLFAFQIYGDFAGYSHIAIGAARLFGVSLRRNFAYPYFSCSLAEFWHRWHISLSTWFRDYVYIPLGGSRTSDLRRRLNILVTFVLSGIWHGAGFTFVVWGLVHGLAVAAQWWKPGTVLEAPGRGRRLAPLQMLLTFHLALVAWVFFRSRSIADAGAVLKGAFLEVWVVPSPPLDWFPAALVGLLLVVEWIQRRRPHGLEVGHLHVAVRWSLYLLTALAIVSLGRMDVVPFIYFQF